MFFQGRHVLENAGMLGILRISILMRLCASMPGTKAPRVTGSCPEMELHLLLLKCCLPCGMRSFSKKLEDVALLYILMRP